MCTRSYTQAVAFAGFARQTLAPFDEAQTKRFVGARYDAQASLGRLTKTKADESVADLRQAALSVHLRELASNPMLLTTMAIVHQSQVGLPRERVRLYSQAVDVLLKRWQKHEGVAIAPVGNRASAGFPCQTSVSTGGRATAPSMSTSSTRRGCERFCTHSGIMHC